MKAAEKGQSGERDGCEAGRRLEHAGQRRVWSERQRVGRPLSAGLKGGSAECQGGESIV